MQARGELIRAPAKVNLFLRICGRRPDGYHLIDSLMVPVSLCDDLQIMVHAQPQAAAQPRIVVHTDSPSLPSGPENLAYRAAAAFLAVTKDSALIEIDIRKRIPLGAGLGGGSSDAAAVLIGLNRLLGQPFDTPRLASLATQIGADVPFFVYGRPARVGGVGDHVVPVTLGAQLNIVVCCDGYQLSTAEVYSRLRARPISLTSKASVSNIATFVEGRKPFTDLLVNDLEEAAAEIHPEVLSLKARVVNEGAQAALMTGSGSAVFGIWADAQSAADGAARLRRQGLWAEAVETLELSPALGH